MAQIKYLISVLLLGTVSTVYASQSTGPWFTGPLLAAAGATVPAGHINFEPYLFVTDTFGFYNNQWVVRSTPVSVTVSPTAIITYGLNDWMDIQASLPYNINNKSGQTSSNIADTSLTLGFQIIHDKPGSWRPDLRLSIAETFPTGRFQNLNPIKNGTDAMGAGSYQTSIGANFQKLCKLNNEKYLRSRLSIVYTIPASRTVSGFNAFGGGFGTNGVVNLGNKFSVDLSFEYTLTQHWVPALDITSSINQASTFSGTPGVMPNGLPAVNLQGSSDVLSVAPAIEYNFSSTVGVIAGAWFSVIGRNNSDFVSGIVALNIYH